MEALPEFIIIYYGGVRVFLLGYISLLKGKMGIDIGALGELTFCILKRIYLCIIGRTIHVLERRNNLLSGER